MRKEKDAKNYCFKSPKAKLNRITFSIFKKRKVTNWIVFKLNINLKSPKSQVITEV